MANYGELPRAHSAPTPGPLISVAQFDTPRDTKFILCNCLFSSLMGNIGSYISQSFPPKSKFAVDSDIPDFTGHIILVTGGNGGIGYEIIKALLPKKCQGIYAQSIQGACRVCNIAAQGRDWQRGSLHTARPL
ncbi:hypothetical protein FB451DRAFT_1218548 [Mycena latifolia]|nr:hypothetical protein FB451DRAFT_1218548 [Mycena latifolia]